ncbi:MAG: VanZ family protein, partial [Saprospiraceae bacterium]|nr:VanZ family protein [Saprospiraceae bacterium]
MKAKVALITWVIIMTVSLLMPTEDLEIESIAINDKVIHVILFFVLAYLILNAITEKFDLKYVSLAVICASLFGICIEYLQDELNTGRYFDYFDIIANI